MRINYTRYDNSIYQRYGEEDRKGLWISNSSSRSGASRRFPFLGDSTNIRMLAKGEDVGSDEVNVRDRVKDDKTSISDPRSSKFE